MFQSKISGLTSPDRSQILTNKRRRVLSHFYIFRQDTNFLELELRNKIKTQASHQG